MYRDQGPGIDRLIARPFHGRIGAVSRGPIGALLHASGGDRPKFEMQDLAAADLADLVRLPDAHACCDRPAVGAGDAAQLRIAREG
jgi:hypothetical protein